MVACNVRIAGVTLLLGTAAAFSTTVGLPHLARARAGTNAQAISMLSVRPLRGASPMAALSPVSERKVSLLALNQMPVIVNKWADPNWDPTKDEISTKVPLHIAAFKGNVEEVQRLLAEGADVDERDFSAWTALQWAARGAGTGQHSPRATEVMEVLKAAGADVLAENLTGHTSLHHAAHWGNAKATALVISWFTPEQRNKQTKLGWSPLHWAGKAGAADVAKLLLDSGSEPNLQNLKGNTALHEAAQQESVEVMQVLVAGGVDPEIQNLEKEVPLFNTAYLGFYDSSKMLLAGGADPNCIDIEGNAPLMMACRAGNEEIVDLLLEYKADVNLVNKDGLTALHEVCARMMSFGTQREDLTERFIKAGANVNLKMTNGDTPLHVATRVAKLRDDADVMGLLLGAGALRDAKNAEGLTPWDIAIQGMVEADIADSEVCMMLKK